MKQKFFGQQLLIQAEIEKLLLHMQREKVEEFNILLQRLAILQQWGNNYVERTS